MSWPIDSATSRALSRWSAVASASACGNSAASGLLDQREIAVEIGARAEMEAALQIAEQILRAADRIGRGHDGDVAQDAPFGFRDAQLRHQRVDGDDARQLAAVQRGLQIGRRRCGDVPLMR